MPLIQNSKIAFSKTHQSAFQTASPVGNMWAFTKLNADVNVRQLGTEDDAPEIGKTTEFPQNVYNTAWDTRGQLNKYMSIELWTWLTTFGLGNTVITGTGPYIYTVTPLLTATTLQLPAFTQVMQLPGTDYDSMAVGCCLDQFSMTLNSGPGRQNAQFTAQWIGSGLLTEPSGITIPALTPETLMNAAGMALSILGVDYVANKDIYSLTIGWNNNLRADEGYFPGSGYQNPSDPTSGQVRGRLEVGTRALSIQCVIYKDSASAQYAALKAGTIGTMVLSLSGASSTGSVITVPNARYRTIDEGSTNGKDSMTLGIDALWTPSAGNISIVNTCLVGAIG